MTDTEIVHGCGGFAQVKDSEGQTLILENERVRVTRIMIAPGERLSLHPPCGMLVSVSGGRLGINGPGGEEQMAFNPAGFKWRDQSTPLESSMQAARRFMRWISLLSDQGRGNEGRREGVKRQRSATVQTCALRLCSFPPSLLPSSPIPSFLYYLIPPFISHVPSSKKNITALAALQGLLITNNITVISLGSLTGYMLAQDKAFATLPSTAYIAGGACSTFLLSQLMRRYGRRAGFTLGALAGMAGAPSAPWRSRCRASGCSAWVR